MGYMVMEGSRDGGGSRTALPASSFANAKGIARRWLTKEPDVSVVRVQFFPKDYRKTKGPTHYCRLKRGKVVCSTRRKRKVKAR